MADFFGDSSDAVKVYETSMRYLVAMRGGRHVAVHIIEIVAALIEMADFFGTVLQGQRLVRLVAVHEVIVRLLFLQRCVRRFEFAYAKSVTTNFARRIDFIPKYANIYLRALFALLM